MFGEIFEKKKKKYVGVLEVSSKASLLLQCLRKHFVFADIIIRN